MSITDELRGYVQSWRETPNLMDDLDAGDIDGLLGDFEHIADRIDAEHERVRSESSIAIIDMTDESMGGHGWVRLPKDADGVPIHVGDVMAYADNTKPMQVVALVPPAVFLTEDGPRYADMCRHHHTPTVEDVLTEFGIDWEHESDCEDRAVLLKEYASKLQLREDA